MYSYMMHEVAKQRTAERQEEARRSNLARALRKAKRQRNRVDARSTFVPPAIPDYVDGTFREAGAEVPAERAGAGR
jgi:hypothetical protein